jgi:hypothetical protein
MVRQLFIILFIPLWRRRSTSRPVPPCIESVASAYAEIGRNSAVNRKGRPRKIPLGYASWRPPNHTRWGDVFGNIASVRLERVAGDVTTLVPRPASQGAAQVDIVFFSHVYTVVPDQFCSYSTIKNLLLWYP